MTIVGSRDNPRYRAVQRLIAGGSRKRGGLSILEGTHLCLAYLERGWLPTTCVVGAAARTHPEVAAILQRLPSSLVLVIADSLYRSLSALEQAVALLFVFEVPQSIAPLQIGEDAVLLDRLQDPGNLGSILRSAAAAGFSSVFLSRGCVDAWSPKVLRAAMGAHFALRIVENCDLLGLVRDAPAPVFAASSHAERCLYDEPLAASPSIWLFGNEGQGVAADLLAACSVVAIPQPGGEESLNVAAAAAVCLFETSRQRRMASG